MFPANYTRTIFVTEHGSGGREYFLGYRITNLRVHINGTVLSRTTFAEGWLQDRKKHIFWGRPASQFCQCLLRCQMSAVFPCSSRACLPGV